MTQRRDETAEEKAFGELVQLYTTGHFHEVITRASKALEKSPESVALWNILGVAYLALELNNEASEALKRVTVLAPDLPDGFNNLGIALKRIGLLDESIECFQRALGLKPSYFQAQSNIGSALYSKGLLERR